MPISKSIGVNNTGVFATYWVIQNFQFDFVEQTVWCRLSGYLASANYQSGNTSMLDLGISTTIPANISTLTGAQMLSEMYSYILTTAEFTGGTIVA